MSEWDRSMYYFDWDSKRPQYIIDTPPPYPTGNFHIGNALNWCYIDFVARYKRMQGYNVMFPQGWDCHGLPTEVKVEEIHRITKNEVSRQRFRELCHDLTEENIEQMKSTMRRLGFSQDWSNEYVTMEPEYYVKTQRSFTRMYDEDLIYRDDHPVNWCPRCETAIAFAEVEYEERKTKLNYFHFDKLDVATTRPELLAACVAAAVHPDDERYKEYVGEEIEVPIFGHRVPVIADEEVDPEFGTGVVMICTFGDRQDVRWWKKHDLPLRKAIDRQGRLTQTAAPYEGLTIEEARREIIHDMKAEDILYKQEGAEQNVGLCWRCDTPIEILSEVQWFVRVDPDEIIETAREVEWIPEHMRVRLENWASTMEWDWCISRQRIFATPIPVWYCEECDEAMIAREEWLPLDPTQTDPPEPCKCGSTNFRPERDVLDTWMDSSISALNVAGWLTDHELRMPTQLRPQGHDIIRTWAFYTILRTKALVGEKPWDDILINGMVLGEDGYKMSKSRDNFIQPEEVVEQYGADAFRQWAAIGGSPGSDIMFRWKDVVAAGRFLQKVWSIYRFAYPHIADYEAEEVPEFLPVDRWLNEELDGVIRETRVAMDDYQFDRAMRAIRGFAWDTLADNYIELVKSRLYGEDENRDAALYTLRRAIDSLSVMLAPFTPFFADEIWLGEGSVHQQLWPEVLGVGEGEEGEVIKEIVGRVRRYKSEHGIALNAPLKALDIYAPMSIDSTDIEGATNTPTDIHRGKPDLKQKPVGVEPDMSIIGPRFRDKAGDVIKALKQADPMEVAQALERGAYRISLDGEDIELGPESVDVQMETVLEGHEVDVFEVGGVIVVIEK